MSDFGLHWTEKIDMEKLKSYEFRSIIDFGSDSCIPCKEMAPVLEELNSELKGKAIIRFVDVWKYPDLAEGYPVSVIPTQIFFDAEGRPIVLKTRNASIEAVYVENDREHVFTAHEGGVTGNCC
jgi:thioredoxin 1